MVLGKDSEIMQVVLSKKEIKKIKESAKDEDRSMSNWCAWVIRRELKKVKR